MLRLHEDGHISLTINGNIISTITKAGVDELTPRQLVSWENMVRFEHYERRKGFYCKENQRKSREIETSEERLRAYPLSKVELLDSFNKYWDDKRLEAIDN